MNFLKKEASIEDNILRFNISENTAKSVIEFYSKKPFPNYKNHDSKLTIMNSGDKNYLAKTFKQNIGFNKDILEIGCGTGQLSIYFAIGTNNRVVGLDPTIESLRLASKFCKDNKILNVKFVNADLFDNVLKDEYFDFIWCNGVLHHTKDPYEGFKLSVKHLKKDGFILVGLYNKIGRIRTKIRKYIYKIFGKQIIIFLDPMLRKKKLKSDDQIDAWIRDQYLHPVESTHSFDEVLKWFKINDIEFINSIPELNFTNELNDDMFKKKDEGNFISRMFNQIKMLFTSYGDDGGLFIFIGKKNA